jgi:hypothetical protein
MPVQATVPKLEPEIFGCVYWAKAGSKAVQTVKRVMQAYGLIVNLTIEQEDDACERFPPALDRLGRIEPFNPRVRAV